MCKLYVSIYMDMNVYIYVRFRCPETAHRQPYYRTLVVPEAVITAVITVHTRSSIYERKRVEEARRMPHVPAQVNVRENAKVLAEIKRNRIESKEDEPKRVFLACPCMGVFTLVLYHQHLLLA